MKIGLISINMYTKNLNFASPLHTYAFQHFLEENGIHSTIIDYKPIYYHDFDSRHPYKTYEAQYKQLQASNTNSAAIKKKLNSLKDKIDAYKQLHTEREVRFEKFYSFIKRNYKKTDVCYDSDLLEILDPGFDCYICVTDVIWKNSPGDGFDRGYFLASKAMENKWKIAYSASRGANYAKNAEDLATFFYYIDDFDYISVREESLKGYIEDHSTQNSELVLDPVLLLEKEEYVNLAIRPKEDRYILLYYVMEQATDTINMAVEYARKHKIPIVELSDSPFCNRLDSFRDIEKIYHYDIGIEEWLGYILFAERVFTNSFHACCFSILFEKQFYLGYRNGDKTTNLLQEFNLTDRRVSNISDVETLEKKPIDYEKVRDILVKRRNESTQFILKAISKCQHQTKPTKSYEWWKKSCIYKIIYNSGTTSDTVSAEMYCAANGRSERLSNGKWEFYPADKIKNSGFYFLEDCLFSNKGHHFVGWKVRFRIDNRWFWFTCDGKYHQTNEQDFDQWGGIRVFSENERIPYIPVNHISSMVAEATWDKKESHRNYTLFYKSSYPSSKSFFGKSPITDQQLSEILDITTQRFRENPFKTINGYCFIGWKLCVKYRSKTFFFSELGKFDVQNKKKTAAKIFAEFESFPYIPFTNDCTITVEAVWKEKVLLRCMNAVKTWLKKFMSRITRHKK